MILVLDDKKPIQQFLTLKEQMEVALLVSNNTGSRCAGLGVIDECSPRGVWCGFRIHHNFFVVVNITKVNSKYNHQTAYCEEKSITTLGAAINCRVLWSRYKVRPTEPLSPPLGADVKLEGIGGPPTRFQPDKEKNKFSKSDIKAIDDKEAKVDSHGVGAEEKVDKGDTEFASAYPDQPLWRGVSPQIAYSNSKQYF